MNRWRDGAACICAVLILAAVASAQFPGMQGPPSFRGVWAPAVGSGAAYETVRRGEKGSMEISIVGADTLEGQAGHWMEMVTNSREGEMVMKSFAAVKGKETATLRLIMQMGAQEPMELSMEMMGMMQRGQQRAAQRADAREGATRVGTETITVPAGTFTCEHFKTADGDDFWISDKVAPWGIVKSTGKDHSMTLTRLITGAKTKIRGTPKKFDMQEMMKRQQQ